jgi:hypothetical protein
MPTASVGHGTHFFVHFEQLISPGQVRRFIAQFCKSAYTNGILQTLVSKQAMPADA